MIDQKPIGRNVADALVPAPATGVRHLSPPCEGGARGGGPDGLSKPVETSPAYSSTLPPLVKGGLGGVGRRTAASSVRYSPFARNEVWKREAVQSGQPAHAQSNSSIATSLCSVVHSKVARPTPPNPPFTRGGKACATSRSVWPLVFPSRQGDRTGARPTHAARGGFTLIELLVVITIILIVSAVALPTVLPALAHRQVSESARILQAVLAGARDSAIRDNASSGIRLLPDPQFSGLNPSTGLLDNTYPLAYNRIVPIESAPEYSEGLVYTGATASLFASNASVTYPNTGVLYPAANSGGTTNYYPTSVLTVYEAVYSSVTATASIPNPPTNWFWNIRVGDQIQFNDGGPWYTIIGPMVIDPTGGNPEMFVNVRRRPAPFHRSRNAADFLFLVNGQDDNGNGWVDEGWDGVDNNLAAEAAMATPVYVVDDVLEWGLSGDLARPRPGSARSRPTSANRCHLHHPPPPCPRHQCPRGLVPLRRGDRRQQLGCDERAHPRTRRRRSTSIRASSTF